MVVSCALNIRDTVNMLCGNVHQIIIMLRINSNINGVQMLSIFRFGMTLGKFKLLLTRFIFIDGVMS